MTEYPVYRFPSSTVEQRIYAGSIGITRIVDNTPEYWPSIPMAREVERAHRDLPFNEKFAILGRHVLDMNNIEMADIAQCSEKKIRDDIKLAKHYLAGRLVINIINCVKFIQCEL